MNDSLLPFSEEGKVKRSSTNSNGQRIFVADAHGDDGKRFIVHANEKLSAFVELERQVLTQAEKNLRRHWEIIADKFPAYVAEIIQLRLERKLIRCEKRSSTADPYSTS